MTQYLLLFRNASLADGYLTTTRDTAADMLRWQPWIGRLSHFQQTNP